MDTYQPQPLDTTQIELPESLGALLERLAENTHDVWATQRIREGWSYGPQRDDVHKRHPCLVPYAALPDSEKEYDRRVARETLRAVIAAGFEIRPKQGVGPLTA